jgi:hypothetical protein
MQLLDIITIKKTHIKTTMKYHFLRTRMTIIKRKNDSKCWRGCGEIGSLVHFW